MSSFNLAEICYCLHLYQLRQSFRPFQPLYVLTPRFARKFLMVLFSRWRGCRLSHSVYCITDGSTYNMRVLI